MDLEDEPAGVRRRPAARASSRTSATLKMSAARPWMPAFMAWRSPAWRIAEVAGAQLGDRPAAAEERLGVAPLPGLGHGALHVLPHRGEGLEVGVEDVGRLLGRDAEALAQPVGLHAVGQAVGDHLRLRPLLAGDVVGLHAEDARGGLGVDVPPALEGGDQAGVLGQVGDAAQLDLVVVGDQQLEALGGDERPAELLALLGAHRDVVQVRGVGAEPAGAGHGLVEGGVDAAVGRRPRPAGPRRRWSAASRPRGSAGGAR